jgi:tetratricopeptide (TPR) repeat protein
VKADPGRAGPRIALGTALLESGRVEEAAAQLAKAVELDPASAPARTHLASALAREGQLDAALEQLRKALELDPRYAPAHYQLGLALAQRGDTGQAASEWRKALDIDPNHAEAHESLGDALYAQDRPAEALAHWREAIRRRSNDAGLARRAAWVLATSPDRSVRDGREAIALAAQAMQLPGGQDPRVMDTLAAAYAEAGRFADAVLTARRALARATRMDRRDLAEAVRKRLALYEAGTAFRDELHTAE